MQNFSVEEVYGVMYIFIDMHLHISKYKPDRYVSVLRLNLKILGYLECYELLLITQVQKSWSSVQIS